MIQLIPGFGRLDVNRRGNGSPKRGEIEKITNPMILVRYYKSQTAKKTSMIKKARTSGLHNYLVEF